MPEFDHQNQTKRSGDSKVTAGYIITKLDNGIFDVHIGLELIKEGRVGTGYGSAFLIVEKTDGKQFTFGPIYQTEGADVRDGFNRGYSRLDYRTRVQFDDPNEVLTWHLVIGVSESHGSFPRSIEDLKEMILDNAEWIGELAEIAVGGVLTIDDFNVFRTGIR